MPSKEKGNFANMESSMGPLFTNVLLHFIRKLTQDATCCVVVSNFRSQPGTCSQMTVCDVRYNSKSFWLACLWSGVVWVGELMREFDVTSMANRSKLPCETTGAMVCHRWRQGASACHWGRERRPRFLGGAILEAGPRQFSKSTR